MCERVRSGCQWSKFGGTNDLRSLGGGAEGEFGPKSLVIIAKNSNFLALVAPTPLTTPKGRHPGELRRNARLGTQGTQVEGDKKY